jgi:hypothetical protein
MSRSPTKPQASVANDTQDPRVEFYKKILAVNIVSPSYCALTGTKSPSMKFRNSQEDSVVRQRLINLRSTISNQIYNADLFSELSCLLQMLAWESVAVGAEVTAVAKNKKKKIDYMPGLFAREFAPIIFPKGEAPLFHLHAAEKQWNIPLTTEAIVGLYALNSLRAEFPTFQHVYGAFRAPGSSLGGGKMFTDKSFFTTYTMVENLSAASPFLKWNVERKPSAKAVNEVISQVFLAISIAYERFNFSHNNLKLSNIYVHELDKPVTLRFGNVFIETKYIARISNFVFSHVNLPIKGSSDRLVTGKIMPDFGYTPARSNNVTDFYSLILELNGVYNTLDISLKTLIGKKSFEFNKTAPAAGFISILLANMSALTSNGSGQPSIASLQEIDVMDFFLKGYEATNENDRPKVFISDPTQVPTRPRDFAALLNCGSFGCARIEEIDALNPIDLANAGVPMRRRDDPAELELARAREAFARDATPADRFFKRHIYDPERRANEKYLVELQKLEAVYGNILDPYGSYESITNWADAKYNKVDPTYFTKEDVDSYSTIYIVLGVMLIFAAALAIGTQFFSISWLGDKMSFNLLPSFFEQVRAWLPDLSWFRYDFSLSDLPGAAQMQAVLSSLFGYGSALAAGVTGALGTAAGLASSGLSNMYNAAAGSGVAANLANVYNTAYNAAAGPATAALGGLSSAYNAASGAIYGTGMTASNLIGNAGAQVGNAVFGNVPAPAALATAANVAGNVGTAATAARVVNNFIPLIPDAVPAAVAAAAPPASGWAVGASWGFTLANLFSSYLFSPLAAAFIAIMSVGFMLLKFFKLNLGDLALLFIIPFDGEGRMDFIKEYGNEVVNYRAEQIRDAAATARRGVAGAAGYAYRKTAAAASGAYGLASRGTSAVWNSRPANYVASAVGNARELIIKKVAPPLLSSGG